MRKAKSLKKGMIPAVFLATALLASNLLIGCTGSTEKTTPSSSESTETLDISKTEKMTLATIVETGKTEKQTGVVNENAEQTEKRIEVAPKEAKQTVAQTESEPITEKSSEVQEVSAKIQIYEGIYFDTRCFGDNDRPDYSQITCEIVISNVTDTSFDFTVHEVNSMTKSDNVIFLTHTAQFIGDGMEAVFYGNEYTLKFSFPDDHGAHPAATDMQVSGFSPLEGFTYVNNGIPGHGFS